MNKRVYKLIIFATVLIFGMSLNISAQSETDETARVRERAEVLLQKIREEKWDELDKFVVVVIRQIEGETGKIVKSFHKINDKEIKEKVINRFKRTYSVLKPGKIIDVKINEKNKTIAGISYKHEDKDGFRMVLIDGEWYYELEYL